jgi:hypothetical protein
MTQRKLRAVWIAATIVVVAVSVGSKAREKAGPPDPGTRTESRRVGGSTPAAPPRAPAASRPGTIRRPVDPDRGADPRKTTCLAHVVESRHYRVSSDVSRQICEESATLLEQAWPIWCARFSVDESYDAGPGLFPVLIYPNRRQLYEGIFGATGFRVPCLGFVDFEAFRMFALAHSDPYELRRILLHEGTHQFLYRLVGAKRAKLLPRWYDEGCAHEAEKHCLYDGRLELFQDTGGFFTDQIATARTCFKGGVSVPAVLKGWALSDEDSRACGWAIVHFLRTAADERERACFRDWEAALHAGAAERGGADLVSELGCGESLTREVVAFLDKIAPESRPQR